MSELCTGLTLMLSVQPSLPDTTHADGMQGMQAAFVACLPARQQHRALPRWCRTGALQGPMSGASPTRHSHPATQAQLGSSPPGAVHGSRQAECCIALRTPALASGRVHIGAGRRKAQQPCDAAPLCICASSRQCWDLMLSVCAHGVESENTVGTKPRTYTSTVTQVMLGQLFM